MRRPWGSVGVFVVTILCSQCWQQNTGRTMALVHFPSPKASQHSHQFCDDNGHPPYEHTSFEEACQQAAELQVPLVLTQDVTLSETIRLRSQQTLHIQGDRQHPHHGDETNYKRVTIKGDLHSLFLLSNKSRLILEHVDLDHTLHTDNHKEVGAAINLRYKGSVSIAHSTMTSASGFCVWAVQKSRVTLKHCDLVATTRSAMVCFGQAACELHNCRIDRAGVHAVCARGACRIELFSCQITASAARAIYAYANASIRLEDSHVSGTAHPEKAAIEVSSAGCGGGETSSSSLTIRDCKIVDNGGVGIRIRGTVSYDVHSQNILERNAKGDWDIVEQLQDEDSEEASKRTHQGELPPLRRDTAGSSFRRGDWWCTGCHTINPSKGSNNKDDGAFCRNCATEKSQGGRLLTIDEIRQCNQGVDIRKEFLLLKRDTSTTRLDADQTMIASNHHDDDSSTYGVMWQFDGDDEKGWLEYDRESSVLLEAAYQQIITVCSAADSRSTSDTVPDDDDSSTVNLAEGKYRVNLKIMQQINAETQFPRLVRRRVRNEADGKFV